MLKRTAGLRRIAPLPLLLWMSTTSCDGRHEPSSEPPLRPLLYTEAGNVDEGFEREGWEAWTTVGVDPHTFPSSVTKPAYEPLEEDGFDLHSPEGLIRTAYFAATHGDLEALQSLTLTEEGLQSIARVPPSRVEQRYASLQKDMQNFMQSFRPDSPTDARPDGLSGLVQPTAIELGLPRRIDGSLVATAAEAEMYSSNRLRIHVLGSSIDFDIHFPRILKDADDQWKFSEGPVVSDIWHNVRRPGLDLKPALLKGEHAPFPFDVGNYWHYEMKRIPLDGSISADEISPTRSLAYRDTVSDVYNGNIFQIVTLRRTFADPARTPQTRRLLVTARHIYTCSPMCHQRRNNLRYLLDYMSRTTPLFVFPANRTLNWREGGREGGRTTRMAERSQESIIVPAGSFKNSIRIHPTARGETEVIYFEEGIGILREEHRDGETLEQANLVQYRILR